MNGLILHCGSQARTIEEVANVPTPEPVMSKGNDRYRGKLWVPIPHIHLVNTVKESIAQKTSYDISEEAYGVSADGARFFGLFQLVTALGRALVVGIRNAHDKTFPAGVCCGNKVFVCDNLSFSSDIITFRKHTTNILRDLPGKIGDAVLKITDAAKYQELRFNAYQNTSVTDAQAHDLIVRGFHDENVFGFRSVKPLIDEWRKPKYEDFAPRNAWSFFNCVTEVLKGEGGKLFNSNPGATLDRQTIRLHSLMDRFCGVENLADWKEGLDNIINTNVEDAEFEMVA